MGSWVAKSFGDDILTRSDGMRAALVCCQGCRGDLLVELRWRILMGCAASHQIDPGGKSMSFLY